MVCVFVGFWNRDYVSPPSICEVLCPLVKSSFKHTREESESKKAYVFRCLIFSLSGPCELLFLLCLLPLEHEKW